MKWLYIEACLLLNQTGLIFFAQQSSETAEPRHKLAGDLVVWE